MIIKQVEKQSNDIFFQKDDKRFRLRACGIIIKDHHVLMVKNDVDDYYYSLGGAVRLGESIEAACIREVKEETGHDYKIKRLQFIYEHLFPKGSEVWHELTFFFLMEDSDNNTFQESVGSFGAKESKVWIPLDKYHAYNAYPAFFGTELLNLTNDVKVITTLK